MPGMSPRDEALHQQLREEQERERRRAAAEQRMNEHEREARILMAQAEKGDRDTASEKRPASGQGTEDGRLEREVRNVRKHGLKNSYDALQRIQGRGNRLRDDMPPSRLAQRSSIGGGMMRIGQDTESTPKKASAADVSGLVDLLRGKTKQMRQPGAKPRTDNADEELKDAGTIKMFKVAPEPADQTPKGFGSQIEEHARRYFERPGRKLKRFLDSVEKEIEKSRRIRENVQAAEISPVPDMQPGLPDRSFGNPFAPRAAEGSIGEISTKGIIFGNDMGFGDDVSIPQKWSSESPRLQSDLDRIKLNLQEKGRRIDKWLDRLPFRPDDIKLDPSKKKFYFGIKKRF